MGKLKIASFFSGCGGMDLGVTGGFTFMGKRFIQNPVEIVFANDIEPDACDIFDANFSHKIIRGDIRKIRSNQIPDHDILMGGFPCQPFSILAQNPPRLGMNDEDGTLFTELIRILKYKKPSCCILENVKGLLSANNGLALKSIISSLKKIKYNVQYGVINSEAFGVPQKRERVFIIGFRENVDVTPIFSTSSYKPTPLKKILISNIDKKYFFSKKAVDGLKRTSRSPMNKGRVQNINKPCATISAHLSKVSLNGTDPVLKTKNGKYRRFTPREVARIQSFPDTFKLVNSEFRQYRALGNAVPPVMMWNVIRKTIKVIKKNQISQS